MDADKTGLVFTIVLIIAAIVLVMASNGCALRQASFAVADTESGESQMTEHVFVVQKSDEQWREQLTPEQYHVLREAGTEAAFSGEYWNEHADGIYHCAGCGNELFNAATKFDSGTGWPSFYQPIDEGAVVEREDRSHGMVRTEAVCADCGGHLGHVFSDGPQPTGLRYCMNSAALRLEPREQTG